MIRPLGCRCMASHAAYHSALAEAISSAEINAVTMVQPRRRTCFVLLASVLGDHWAKVLYPEADFVNVG